MDKLKEYYAGDEFCAGVWKGKYALKNLLNEVVEATPDEMHHRMAKELARAESHYKKPTPEQRQHLSDFGAWLSDTEWDETFIYAYFNRFRHIIPQGSIMTALGNRYKLLSLSNCFVIPAPLDSYGGIFYTDQQIAQLEKRRGGVGTNLNSLRPEDIPVMNAAGTSTGAHSFMERFSNTTREVAQNGRRGALMLLMMCLHPDIFKFVDKKKDRTKVTGANVSAQLTDEFMQTVDKGEDFLCRFPVDVDLSFIKEEPGFNEWWASGDYNKLWQYSESTCFMKIKARELFDLIVEMAWENAEPGVAFMDRVHAYSPEGVYKAFRAIASNPCGEQWMQAYDACRLLAANKYNFVINPFTPEAYVDFDKVYEVYYVQQRLADDIVDLEIEYIGRIIDKIKNDPEPEVIKAPELELWENIRTMATASRRTGCGFTAMADMIAALGLRYDSDAALEVIEAVMKQKMRAELDCTTDLAVLRGTFQGWSKDLEFPNEGGSLEDVGGNDFYTMLLREFPEQAFRMMRFGRRNVSWSTVAPTGTVSIVGLIGKYPNTSGGMEPHFMPYYFRNKKVNPSDGNVRVDFKDQNGDYWQTFPVVMGGFKTWYELSGTQKLLGRGIEDLTKEELDNVFTLSPYYKACAGNISWERRIEIQGLLQYYTTNAISSTLNLPKEVTKETVGKIYQASWRRGLKGVTIYRDGSRTGVLVTEQQKEDTFSYKDAVKRPKDLEGDLSIVRVKGERYGVIVGFLEGKPYEIFAFNLPKEVDKECRGIITKVKKGHYDFACPSFTFQNIQDAALHSDENVLTRLLSAMLRHGIKPQFVMEQIEKTQLEVVSFGKAVSRILKKYVAEKDLLQRAKCKSCGSTNLAMQEGCLSCKDCGESKCG